KRSAVSPGMRDPNSVFTPSTSSMPSSLNTAFAIATDAPWSSPSVSKLYGASPANPTVILPSSMAFCSVDSSESLPPQAPRVSVSARLDVAAGRPLRFMCGSFLERRHIVLTCVSWTVFNTDVVRMSHCLTTLYDRNRDRSDNLRASGPAQSGPFVDDRSHRRPDPQCHLQRFACARAVDQRG